MTQPCLTPNVTSNSSDSEPVAHTLTFMLSWKFLWEMKSCSATRNVSDLPHQPPLGCGVVFSVRLRLLIPTPTHKLFLLQLPVPSLFDSNSRLWLRPLNLFDSDSESKNWKKYNYDSRFRRKFLNIFDFDFDSDSESKKIATFSDSNSWLRLRPLNLFQHALWFQIEKWKSYDSFQLRVTTPTPT